MTAAGMPRAPALGFITRRPPPHQPDQARPPALHAQCPELGRRPRWGASEGMGLRVGGHGGGRSSAEVAWSSGGAGEAEGRRTPLGWNWAAVLEELGEGGKGSGEPQGLVEAGPRKETAGRRVGLQGKPLPGHQGSGAVRRLRRLPGESWPCLGPGCWRFGATADTGAWSILEPASV